MEARSSRLSLSVERAISTVALFPANRPPLLLESVSEVVFRAFTAAPRH